MRVCGGGVGSADIPVATIDCAPIVTDLGPSFNKLRIGTGFLLSDEGFSNRFFRFPYFCLNALWQVTLLSKIC